MTILSQNTLWLCQLRKHRNIKIIIARSDTGIDLAGNAEALLKQSTRVYSCPPREKYKVAPRIDSHQARGAAA
jgi:hypothetical protein